MRPLATATVPGRLAIGQLLVSVVAMAIAGALAWPHVDTAEIREASTDASSTELNLDQVFERDGRIEHQFMAAGHPITLVVERDHADTSGQAVERLRRRLDPLDRPSAGAVAGRVMTALRELGVARARVQVGDLTVFGAAESTSPWSFELFHPLWTRKRLGTIRGENLTIAAIYRASPRPGTSDANADPERTPALTTVVGDDALHVEGLALAVSQIDPPAGRALLDATPGVEGLIVARSGDMHPSSGWSQRLSTAAPDDDVSRPDSRRLPATVRAGVLITPHDRAVTPNPGRTTPRWPPANAPRPGTDPRPRPSTPADDVTVPAGSARLDPTQPHALASFAVDRTEVTNAAYARFLASTRDDPHRHCHPAEPVDKDHTPRYWSRAFQPELSARTGAAALVPFALDTFRHDEHPVVGVDWWDAFAFSRWAGRQLPTRNQWHRAACGDDDRRWPWGDTWHRDRANIGGERQGEHDGYIYAAPADSFPRGASPFGAVHMAGNVAEWTDEGMAAGGSSASVPSQVTCSAGRWREPGFRAFDLGFRTVAEVNR